VLSSKGLTRFRAFVGIDDEREGSRYASARVRIEGDGRELFRSSVFSARQPPVRVDVDISGISVLVLVTEDADEGLGRIKNYDDHVSWADPEVE